MLRINKNRTKIVFKNRMMVFPFILIVGVLFFLSNDVGIMRWYRLRNERNRIQSEIDHLIRQEENLTSELDRLKNDKEYIRKIAREKFHMVKQGEKVFRVIDRRKLK